MQEFLNWTLNTIREDNVLPSWMEEKKYEWTPVVSKNINNVLAKNFSVIIITDKEREWFLDYILANINKDPQLRPFLPYYDFRNIIRNLDNMVAEEEYGLIQDMLNISFPQGYCFWYIGESRNKRSIIPKFAKNSFLWLFDEDKQDAIKLRSTDEGLDIKLLQLYRLYSLTLSAALFAEIDVER